jgi:GINS complex subunit 1
MLTFFRPTLLFFRSSFFFFRPLHSRLPSSFHGALHLKQAERLRQVVEETNVCCDHVVTSLEAKADKADLRQWASVEVHLRAMQRNKRCGLAYLQERARRIEAARWEVGRVYPKGMQERMSSTEIEYASAYSGLLERYQREMGLDLTTDMSPPGDLMIEVRVLKSCGEIFTESGPINLERNTMHYLRRRDIEPFIRKGLVEQVA